MTDGHSGRWEDIDGRTVRGMGRQRRTGSSGDGKTTDSLKMGRRRTVEESRKGGTGQTIYRRKKGDSRGVVTRRAVCSKSPVQCSSYASSGLL